MMSTPTAPRATIGPKGYYVGPTRTRFLRAMSGLGIPYAVNHHAGNFDVLQIGYTRKYEGVTSKCEGVPLEGYVEPKKIYVEGQERVLMRVCEGEVWVQTAGGWTHYPFPKRTRGKSMVRRIVGDVMNGKALRELRDQRILALTKLNGEKAAKKREEEAEKAERLRKTQEYHDACVQGLGVTDSVMVRAREDGQVNVSLLRPMTPDRARRLMEFMVSEGIVPAYKGRSPVPYNRKG